MNKVDIALLTELNDKLKRKYKQLNSLLNGLNNISEILQYIGGNNGSK